MQAILLAGILGLTSYFLFLVCAFCTECPSPFCCFLLNMAVCSWLLYELQEVGRSAWCQHSLVSFSSGNRTYFPCATEARNVYIMWCTQNQFGGVLVLFRWWLFHRRLFCLVLHYPYKHFGVEIPVLVIVRITVGIRSH